MTAALPTRSAAVPGAPREAGFSVLEALVAIAVLAAALLPILALQGQFVRSVTVMERAEARLSLESVARAHIGALNITENLRGDLTTEVGVIRWEAASALPARHVRSRAGTRSRYETTLYRVKITLNYNGGGTETVEMAALGWRPTRGYLANL